MIIDIRDDRYGQKRSSKDIGTRNNSKNLSSEAIHNEKVSPIVNKKDQPDDFTTKSQANYAEKVVSSGAGVRDKSEPSTVLISAMNSVSQVNGTLSSNISTVAQKEHLHSHLYKINRKKHMARIDDKFQSRMRKKNI